MVRNVYDKKVARRILWYRDESVGGREEKSAGEK
jgi:hypothetical protein